MGDIKTISENVGMPILHRLYYRYTLMTGIYMLDTFETTILHAILLIVIFSFIKYGFSLFQSYIIMI